MGDSLYNMQYGGTDMRSYALSSSSPLQDYTYGNIQGGRFTNVSSATPFPHSADLGSNLSSSMASLSLGNSLSYQAGGAIANNTFSNSLSSPFQQGGLNLSANEFVPRTTGMRQSSSAPSFDHFPIASKALKQSLEAIGSPLVLTPSGSPLSQRRAKSPMPPQLDLSAASHQEAELLQENVGGTTYFFNKDEYISPTAHQTYPSFSVYTGVPAHIAHLKTCSSSPLFFINEELKLELLSRQAAVLSEVEGATDIPQEVDNYCRLVPLELVPRNQMSQFGFPSTCYKAVNRKDGYVYCLRRVHGFKVNLKCTHVIDTWKKISHTNIVGLREVFTTKHFGDNSIVFVYDYHPNAQTLAAKHFNNPNVHNGYSSPYNLDGTARPFSAGKVSRAGSTSLLPENLLWSYIIQLSSALRIIHASNLACHTMDPNKILITDKSRLRLNCGGIFDVLSFDPTGNTASLLAQYQREDLQAFGTIVLGLACNSIHAVQREHMKASLELVKRSYSSDLYNIIMTLLSHAQCSINLIMPMIGARFYVQLDSLHSRCDMLENELSKECESGRLFRLLTKLNTVLERREFSLDPSWAETGDRYLLKLFRDYVFHQTDEDGSPWVDMSHIVSCLNKLDAGVQEKICLTSSDQTSVLIVTYRELKRCFETAFSEIMQASTSSFAH